MSNVVFCLMGPTASGKTAIACEWVQQLPFEIISVDSAMIYQGMDIGTAKPDAETLHNAPHHLINICRPTERYSAAQFCEDASAAMMAIRARHKFPLLVGGTMMYFRALQQGLSLLPQADETLRATLLAKHQTHGQLFMHHWLSQVDPITAARLHPHDTQRTQRALEVYLLTNTPLSQHLSESTSSLSDTTFINISLFPLRRVWLHERIAMRFQLMLEQGFLHEVAELKARWNLTSTTLSMKSVGYRQAFDYLEGRVDYAAFVEQGVIATRQLAKRQLTWLRSWPTVHHYDPEDSQCMDKVMAHVIQIMDNS